MRTHPPKIAYIGHHGTTELYLQVHRHLLGQGLADHAPGFLTFNGYWKRRIQRVYPGAFVSLFPNALEWALMRTGKDIHDIGSQEFLRAWKIDKVLRHRAQTEVAPLWNQTLSRCARFMDAFKPDLIISEQIQTLPCYATYTECKKRSIRFVQIIGSRLKNRFQFHLNEDSAPYGLDFQTPLPAASLAFADSYVQRIRDTSYTSPYAHLDAVRERTSLVKWSHIPKVLHYFAEQALGGILEPTSPSVFHPFISKWRSQKIKFQHRDPRFFKGISDVREIKGPKLFFPLHVTPEASTDLWAPQYNNMLETVRGITSQLPAGWTLVMKEHPWSVFIQRNVKELSALKSLERSVLVSPGTSNDELLKECRALVVINSTLGIEAMIKGHPVITLGHPFYDLSGNTLPCSSLENLPQMIERARTFRPDPHKNVAFIAAYHAATTPGNPFNPSLIDNCLEPDNVRQIAEGIADRFLKPPHSIQDRTWEQMQEGSSARVELTVTEADMDTFSRLSGDFNPIHTDENFAKANGFKGRVVYAGLIVSAISRLLGMEMPGLRCLWQSLTIQFGSPLYMGETAQVQGVVTYANPDLGILQMKIEISRDGRKIAHGKAQVGILKKDQPI